MTTKEEITDEIAVGRVATSFNLETTPDWMIWILPTGDPIIMLVGILGVVASGSFGAMLVHRLAQKLNLE